MCIFFDGVSEITSNEVANIPGIMKEKQTENRSKLLTPKVLVGSSYLIPAFPLEDSVSSPTPAESLRNFMPADLGPENTSH